MGLGLGPGPGVPRPPGRLLSWLWDIGAPEAGGASCSLLALLTASHRR
jgi:hypothetical protein